jgi:hypothetical protein
MPAVEEEEGCEGKDVRVSPVVTSVDFVGLGKV